MLLTSALPAGEWALKNIDLSKASQYLDYINLMTYDFSGPWSNLAGHHAQLYTPTRIYQDAACLSCSSAVAYVLSKNVPAGKVILGELYIFATFFPFSKSFSGVVNM